MMYSEFIELSGKTEKYITYNEYTNEIEPIYIKSNCTDKKEFMKLFEDAFQKIVYPSVEKAIKNLSSKIKEAYINHEISIDEEIGKTDRAARKIAYQYLELISQL